MEAVLFGLNNFSHINFIILIFIFYILLHCFKNIEVLHICISLGNNIRHIKKKLINSSFSEISTSVAWGNMLIAWMCFHPHFPLLISTYGHLYVYDFLYFSYCTQIVFKIKIVTLQCFFLIRPYVPNKHSDQYSWCSNTLVLIAT